MSAKEKKQETEFDYSSLSFESKVDYWFSVIHSDMRDRPYGNSYRFFDKEDYKNWKEEEPEIDNILKEVMKQSYLLGINKRSFYLQIGEYWKVLFP